jgi:hypothetical protein
LYRARAREYIKPSGSLSGDEDRHLRVPQIRYVQDLGVFTAVLANHQRGVQDEERPVQGIGHGD